MAKISKGRTWIFAREASQILFVQPVDANKQYTVNLSRYTVIQQACGRHQEANSHRKAEQSDHLRYLHGNRIVGDLNHALET